MRNILIIALGLFLSMSSFGQSPQKFSFQAVIRNADNQLIEEGTISMQISILKGSIAGSAVYMELHRSTTNSNGLVSVEIGNGALVSGDFSEIDWSQGPFFIKTETDPSGGSSYSITGVSQLLSVPFALHSSTADGIVGGVSSKETDPIFEASVAKGITELDTVNWNNHTVDTKLSAADIADFGYVKGPHTDSSAFANFGYVAGPHTDSTAIANMGFISDAGAKSYSIGDFAQGGVVFWLDETGQHGLVCAKLDQSAGVRWYAGTNGNTQAKGDGPFAGEANTTIAIASQVAIGDDGEPYAARICNELVITESDKAYGDWYLPSMEELNLMFINKEIINSTAKREGGDNFASDFYWSSTELNNRAAMAQQFNAGLQIGFNKNVPRNVRAIRAF